MIEMYADERWGYERTARELQTAFGKPPTRSGYWWRGMILGVLTSKALLGVQEELGL
jgi:hypothetical protein